MASNFGLAKIKKEGEFITYDDGRVSDAPPSTPSTWVEVRVPEHLADDVHQIIDKFLDDHGYPNF